MHNLNVQSISPYHRIIHVIYNSPCCTCVPFCVWSRFGKKKDDKSKDAAKASKGKLEALSEEELDRIPDNRDGYESHLVSVLVCSHFRVSKEREREPESSRNHKRVFFVGVVKGRD